MWETANGKQKLRFNAGPDHDNSLEQGIVSLVFTPDGKGVITGGGGRISLWDAAKQGNLHPFAVPDRPDPEDDKIEKGFFEQNVAVSPDGRLLAAGGRMPHTLRLWELSTRKLRKRLPASSRPMFEHRHKANWKTVHGYDPSYTPFLRLAPNGRTLVWNQGYGIQLWDLARNKELRLFGGQGGEVTGMAFLAGPGSPGRFQQRRHGSDLGPGHRHHPGRQKLRPRAAALQVLLSAPTAKP